MNDRLLDHDPIPTPIDAWHIYDKHINSGDVAVVVGPSDRFNRDPTLLFALTKVYPTGEVHIADPLWDKNYPFIHGETTQGGPVVTVGGLKNHLHQIDQLLTLGIMAHKPTWLGKDSGVYNIPLDNASANIVIDHNTSPFIFQHERALGAEFDIHFQRVFQEYFRILKPSGRLLFQTGCREYEKSLGWLWPDMAKRLMDLWLNRGGQVERHIVNDTFRIPISDDVASSIRSRGVRYNSEGGGAIDMERFINNDGHSYLLFDGSMSFNSDLFVVTKP